MSAAQGYYSLIQYCPDATRLEAATVGVLLFCPERGFLKALTARHNRRIRRFFGSQGHDWHRLNSFKLGLHERLEVEQPNIQTLEDLNQFIALRANRLQMTPPRSIRVEEPEQDLKNLFQEIVGGAEHPGPGKQGLVRFVGKRLLSAGVKSKLAENIQVVVPVFDRPTTIPYGFQNGRFNLIQPVPFRAAKSEQAVYTACRYAVEGRSLYDTPDKKLGPLQLIIVGMFRPKDTETKEAVNRVLSDSQVNLYAVQELNRLIHEIRTTGKDLNLAQAH